MENKDLPGGFVTSLQAERNHLARIKRRIEYLHEKIRALKSTGKENKFEISEMEALTWAYKIAASAHRTNERFFKYLVRKFPQHADD